MTEDNELLRRYLEEGSDTSFSELVQRNLDLVYGAALRRIGDPHRAEDIAQTVFIDLARKARALRHHPALASWLHTSARYAALKVIRSEQRRQAREAAAQAMQQLSDPPPEWERLKPILDDVLHELGERDRQVVLLRFFRGLPFTEVAAMTGSTEGAARMRIDRVLEKMNQLMARRGIQSTASALGVALASQPVVAAPVGLVTTISSSALAAGSAPATGLITFMSAQKSAATLGLVGLLSLGIGVHQWHEAQRLHAATEAASLRLAATERDRSALLQRSNATEKMLAEAQAENARLSAPVTAPRPVAAKAGNAAAAQAKAKADWDEFATLHPEARGIMIEKYKDQLRLANRLFFLQNHLTPAQIDTLLTRAAEFTVNTRLGLMASTDLPAEAGLPQLAGQQEWLREVMGEQAVLQARESLRMGPLGSWLNGVRSTTGISDEQEIQLAQIVAQNSPAFRNGGMWNRNSMDWANAYQEARNILSPAQFAAAESFFLTLQYRQALDQANQRGPGYNQGATPAAK